MSPKKISSKAVWAVSAAVIIVVVTLILLFLTQSPSKEKESIVLPAVQNDPASEVTSPSEDQIPEQDSHYFEVTNDNVLTALRSLSRPSAYHQSYLVTVGSDAARANNTVEFWVNGQFVHAEISGDQSTRSVVSDGNIAYLWYDTEDSYISVTLTDDMTVEDLLGLPDFDSYLTIEQEYVVDSGYLVLEEAAVQCIYVCTQDEISDTCRYWVNLDNGLLYQADVLENSNQVYAIRQTLFEALAMEDESFQNRFLLPDGSAPFMAAREMPQP